MDLNSSSGMFQGSTEAANNQRWRTQISEDVVRDHAFKAEMGMFSRDPTCLGFKSKGRKTQAVEPVWDQLDLAVRIFTLFVEGEDEGEDRRGPFGTNGIACFLMDEGVRWPKGLKGHKAKDPGRIHESQIRTVLTNCMYVARWRPLGQEYDCPRLLVPVLDADGNPTGERRTAVPETLCNDAQRKLALRRRPDKRSLSSVHLTTGLAVCARCGRPLHVQQAHGKVEKGPRRGERREPERKFKCPRRRGTRPCPGGSSFGLQEDVLDAWVMKELAPVLVAEMAAIRSSAGRERDAEDLSRLERRLAEAKTRETRKLTVLIDALDNEQYTAVAAQLRAEREQLERQIKTVHGRLDRSEQQMPDLDPAKLASLPKSAVKDALCRAIAWIAVGKAGTGVVAHTRWNSYIGAAYRKGDVARGESPNKTYLSAPSLVEVLTCLQWLSDPEEFVRGRRDALGRAAESLTDEELLPGVLFTDDEEEAVVQAVEEDAE